MKKVIILSMLLVVLVSGCVGDIVGDDNTPNQKIWEIEIDDYYTVPAVNAQYAVVYVRLKNVASDENKHQFAVAYQTEAFDNNGNNFQHDVHGLVKLDLHYNRLGEGSTYVSYGGKRSGYIVFEILSDVGLDYLMIAGEKVDIPESFETSESFESPENEVENTDINKEVVEQKTYDFDDSTLRDCVVVWDSLETCREIMQSCLDWGSSIEDCQEEFYVERTMAGDSFDFYENYDYTPEETQSESYEKVENLTNQTSFSDFVWELQDVGYGGSFGVSENYLNEADGKYYVTQEPAREGGLRMTASNRTFSVGEKIEYKLDYISGSGNRLSKIVINDMRLSDIDDSVQLGFWNNDWDMGNTFGTYTIGVSFGNNYVKVTVIRPDESVWESEEIVVDMPSTFGVETRTGHNGAIEISYYDFEIV
jgi:hypothetical protein